MNLYIDHKPWSIRETDGFIGYGNRYINGEIFSYNLCFPFKKTHNICARRVKALTNVS